MFLALRSQLVDQEKTRSVDNLPWLGSILQVLFSATTLLIRRYKGHLACAESVAFILTGSLFEKKTGEKNQVSNPDIQVHLPSNWQVQHVCITDGPATQPPPL